MYHIVTGVTSDIGVPSTYLVNMQKNFWHKAMHFAYAKCYQVFFFNPYRAHHVIAFSRAHCNRHCVTYRQVSNIRHTVDNNIVNHSDVVGIACRRCSNYIFILDLASLDWTKTTARRDEKLLSLVIWCTLYKRFYGNACFQWSCSESLT